jgi:hypothetical protein
MPLCFDFSISKLLAEYLVEFYTAVAVCSTDIDFTLEQIIKYSSGVK